MKKENLLKNRLQEIPIDIEEFVSLSFDISDRIRDVLEEKNISQKGLAQLLGKRESEISKWLKGTHNFTLETIAKISIVLDAKLFYVPTKTKSIFEIREAITAFDFLCKSKIPNECFLSLKLSVPPKELVYKNNDFVEHTAAGKKISIKKENNITKYRLACSVNLVDSNKGFVNTITV